MINCPDHIPRASFGLEFQAEWKNQPSQFSGKKNLLGQKPQFGQKTAILQQFKNSQVDWVGNPSKPAMPFEVPFPRSAMHQK